MYPTFHVVYKKRMDKSTKNKLFVKYNDDIKKQIGMDSIL